MSAKAMLRIGAGLQFVLLFVLFTPWCYSATGRTPDDLQRGLASNVACPLDADQKDLSIWPNCVSSGNSDPWISQNHANIRKMKPRVLVLNFANSMDMGRVKKYTEDMIQNLANSTRYHGYSDPAAPAFVEYQVVKYVDMRDNPPEGKKNSALAPYQKADLAGKDGYSTCDYSRFYSPNFAASYGFTNSMTKDAFMHLGELINAGIVHELWFFWVHDEHGAPLETVENKQYYNDNCQPLAAMHGPAGNGHCKSMPWSGRSFRITFFNPDRGLGCGMENFCHALEGMARGSSIPYFKRYFSEFADFNLDKRYDLPGDSLYAMIGGEDDAVEYSADNTMQITSKGNVYEVANYVAAGGNVHFPPGARKHYDQESPFTVKSTIENFRLGNGQDGKDKAEPFNKDKFKQYRSICPDGMGPWLMYWRQSFPGLDNKCKDDMDRPMKNWWPFLFY